MSLKKQRIEIKIGSFEHLDSFFTNKEFDIRWNCLFILPVWLKTWWYTFGNNNDATILTGYRNGKLIGIAPFRVQGETARFIGDENVCDYQDIAVSPNHHDEFFEAILSYLKKRDIRFLQRLNNCSSMRSSLNSCECTKCSWPCQNSAPDQEHNC